MPRKKKEKKKFKFKSTERFLVPDARYGDVVVAKFVNCIMKRGKKTIAEGILYGALEIIGKRVKDVEPLEVFHKALNNVKPEIEVRSRRVGGTTYQVPMPISAKRQQSLALCTQSLILFICRGVTWADYYDDFTAHFDHGYRSSVCGDSFELGRPQQSAQAT